MGILLVDISSFIMMEGKPHAMSNHLAKVTRQAEHVDRIQQILADLGFMDLLI